MHATRRTLISEEEFLRLPESSTKTELIDGEVIVSPAPSVRHQEICQRLFLALNDWVRASGSPLRMFMSPVDIRFRSGRILQPDIAIWLNRIELPERGPIEIVPNICVEVLSGNRVHDRVTKRLIYAEHGVQELWIVERQGPVERWYGEGLDEAEEHYERLRSPLLPGLDIDLSLIFKD